MAASVSSPPRRPSRANTDALNDFFPESSPPPPSFPKPTSRQTRRMSPPSFDDTSIIPLESQSSLNPARAGIAINGGNSPKKSTLGLRSKRVEISRPYDFVHLTHVSESSTGELIGLPKEWQQLLQEHGIDYKGQEKHAQAVMEIVKFYQEGRNEDVWGGIGHADDYPQRPAPPPPKKAPTSGQMKPAPAPYRPAPTPQPVSPNVIYRPVSQSQPQLQSLRSPPAPPQLASNTINNPMSQSSGQFQSIRPAPAPPQALNAIDRSMSQSPGQFQPTRPAPAPPRASNAIDRSMSQRPNTPKKPLEQINSTSLMERKQQQDPLLPQILPSIQQQQQQPQEPLATKGSLGASSKSPSLVAPAGVGPHERDRERQRAREHGPLQEKRGAQILSQTDVQRQQTEPILRSSSLHMPLKTPVALAGEGERELERARERERDLDWQELERDHQKANRGDRQSEPPTAATAQSSPPATAAFDMNTIQRIAMTVLDDREVKKKFLAMSQSDPIPVANLFQTLLDQDDLPTQTRSQLARSLARLAKSSRCYPDCLTLTTIRRTGTDPVAGGGFADVWKGFFAEEPVALKALRIYKHSIREKALKEFSHEAVIWRQLKHPNILPFYGVFTGDEHFDRLCLVSPWMDAGNAIDYLNVHPDGNRLSLLSDVAQGLKYLHLFQPPIIHGDLKGANIFVSPSFTACLGDFGLARFRDSQESTLATTTGNMTGTLRWQAPELLNTVEGESTRRSEQCDIYSFGCVCLELMTGKPPFSEIRIDGAVMMAIAKGQIPQRPLENAIERGLDDTLWDLMQQCWNFDPALRPRIAQVAEYFQGHRGAARLGTVTIEDITHRGVRVSSGQHGLPDRFVSDLSNLLNQVEGDVPFV